MITLEELILAWRKAKVDLYYSTNTPLFEIADYEDKLLDNLERLRQCINGNDEGWVTRPDFLGTWTLAHKAITFPKDPKKPEESASIETTMIFASPTEEWASLNRIGGEKPTAEFRLMARCSIDFHVFSALWMMKVGHRFDKELGDNVFGSRLRRNGNGEINEMALGSFKPYLKPFRDWRDGAIKAMRSALADKKDVIALTADVSSFFHQLNPGFMLDKDFHEKVGVTLKKDETKLNQLFINALQAWAQKTPLRKGLPVGLPASAVIANVALIELDQFIDRQVVPLYYGRYVDDILLVMHNTSKFTTSTDFWEWIINRDGGNNLLKQENGGILFSPGYLVNGDSHIAFENSKNKLFVLASGPGTALVNAISEQISQRASEWRALPDLPDNPGTIATDLLKATNHAGEQADNLRKTDALTLHRAGFALNLRDYEAFERDLPPNAWQAHRHAFFEAVIDHMLTPVRFFELAQYLPRIVRMATACEDFKHLGKILNQMNELCGIICNQCDHEIKASKDASDEDKQKGLHRWQKSLTSILVENILSALPPQLSATSQKDWQSEVDLLWQNLVKDIKLTDKYSVSLRALQKLHASLFSHDLAHIPLRFCGLPKEMLSQRGIPARKKLINANWNAGELKPLGEAISTLAAWFKPNLPNGIPPGLYFATRPFSLNELYLIVPQPFNSARQPDLGKVICALRGFDPSEYKMPQWDKQQCTLQISGGETKASQTIAVASWETNDNSFLAAVMKQPDPDSRRRYQRLNRLINELISRPDHAGYLILPELAMPAHWFMRIAEKLNGRHISLITGVEYLHDKKNVHNQIWASLTHDGLGFPSLMVYRQDKQIPALHEEHELYQRAGSRLKPATLWKRQSPPIIRHGNFHFALLNCSELTNIRYRAELCGKIDALFVLEWNSDIDTFNALVESAALDIHAYIIQCNNRQYGDSRIRAPYKDRWRRDLLRVKGGNHDYCVIGEINVLALRQFQSNHRSPDNPFKPVPDGFEIAHTRKTLYAGKNHE